MDGWLQMEALHRWVCWDCVVDVLAPAGGNSSHSHSHVERPNFKSPNQRVKMFELEVEGRGGGSINLTIKGRGPIRDVNTKGQIADILS